jgi:hypothetical protein
LFNNQKIINNKKKIEKLKDEYRPKYLIMQNEIFIYLCLRIYLLKSIENNRNKKKYGTENIMHNQTYKKYYSRINIIYIK